MDSQSSLGFRDKNGQELFAGDRVQIVNGAKAGTVIHNITAAAKPFTNSGGVHLKDGRKDPLEIVAKKVIKLK